MEVKLISVTPEAEKTVMYCARVSNPKNQDNDNPKLLSYCAKNGHWSIFEMANMVVEISTSRAISAQILRHRSFSFQEFSQRYAEVQSCEVYPARSQDLKNRQNSKDDMSEEAKAHFTTLQENIQRTCQEAYANALAMGVAKEQARFLLPMSSSTKLYMNGTLRSWIHYFMVRLDKSTQKEHRDIALAVWKVFKKELPIVAEALIDMHEVFE